MQKILATLTVSLLAAAIWAAESKPLGAVNLSIKGDYLAFTHKDLKDAKVDKGPLGGAALYLGLVEGLYIGGEGGFARNKGTVTLLDTSVENTLMYVPIELNAKYVLALTSWLALDVGGGACCGYARLEESAAGEKETETDWLPGGQGFADLNFIAGPLFIGINGKYQLTKKFKDADFNLNNWQVGAQLGLAF
jgi:hypothetical protein